MQEIKDGSRDDQTGLPAEISCLSPLKVRSDIKVKQGRNRFKRNKKRNTSFEDLVQGLKTMIAAPEMEEDEIEVFTKSISAQMRKLPEEAAVDLMSDIQRLISAKRLEYLRGAK